VTRPYADAAAFRQALDARIRTLAAERGAPIQGLQLKVAIERLLARLFHGEDRRWLLKGGYAMELRFRPRARATRDVDLAMRSGAPADSGSASVDAAHRALLEAAQADLGDHFNFSIAAGRGNIAGAPGGGASFGVTATVAGRVFARFGLDVGFGDAEFGAPEPLEGEDFLGFAGCANARARGDLRASRWTCGARRTHAAAGDVDRRVHRHGRPGRTVARGSCHGISDAAAVLASVHLTGQNHRGRLRRPRAGVTASLVPRGKFKHHLERVRHLGK
jgi:hypothetical protein